MSPPTFLKPIDPLPGPWFQWRDPVGFVWNRFDVPIAGLPAALAGFRIVHLTDTHCTADWQRAIDTLHDRLGADPPELLVFTGDLLDDKATPRRGPAAVAARFAAGLRATGGCFAVLGNHDAGFAGHRFNTDPLRYIEGRRLLVNAPGRPAVELIGLVGPQREDLPDDFAASMPAKTPGMPRLVIGHYPDHVRRISTMQPDVYLAGHTHGGQACLPRFEAGSWFKSIGYPVIRHDALPWTHWNGVHRMGETWLVSNRGFGFSALPLRMFCAAEVVEIRPGAGESVMVVALNRRATRRGGSSRRPSRGRRSVLSDTRRVRRPCRRWLPSPKPDRNEPRPA